MRSEKRRAIRWLLAARDDFLAVIDEIQRDHPEAVEKWSTRIMSRVELLTRFPYLGPASPYVARVRYLPIGNFVIYYTVGKRL